MARRCRADAERDRALQVGSPTWTRTSDLRINSAGLRPSSGSGLGSLTPRSGTRAHTPAAARTSPNPRCHQVAIELLSAAGRGRRGFRRGCTVRLGRRGRLHREDRERRRGTLPSATSAALWIEARSGPALAWAERASGWQAAWRPAAFSHERSKPRSRRFAFVSGRRPSVAFDEAGTRRRPATGSPFAHESRLPPSASRSAAAGSTPLRRAHRPRRGPSPAPAHAFELAAIGQGADDPIGARRRGAGGCG